MESRQNETLQNENLLDHEDTCTEVPTFADKEILPGNVHTYVFRKMISSNNIESALKAHEVKKIPDCHYIK